MRSRISHPTVEATRFQSKEKGRISTAHYDVRIRGDSIDPASSDHSSVSQTVWRMNCAFLGMESLPVEICLKIFCFLDHQHLVVAQQVCRKWKLLASDNRLWSNLFKERWGEERAAFYFPNGSKSWKDVFEVQDRCDRVGVGLKIIREGCYYYLVHQGEIQRCLGSRRNREEPRSLTCHSNGLEREFTSETGSCLGILDKILFFIGDLEVASADAKRSRVT